MTEFLKNNLSVKDLIWILLIIVPGIIAWTNVESEQAQQRKEIMEIKTQMRDDRKEINTKFDRILYEITTLKVEMQGKKNIER